MCGRYANTASAGDLSSLFTAVDETGGTMAPAHNVAPTASVPVVVTRPDADGVVDRRLRLARWGLIPSWAKDPSIGNRLINARAESVATKPAFRKALAARRCLVPAAPGFYEWQKLAGQKRKQPWLIHAADGDPLAFAGLYEIWRDAEGTLVATCTIITTEQAPDIAHIHDRSPVILPPSAWEHWLDPAVRDPAEVAGLLAPAPAGTLAAYRVGPDVGNVRNDHPGLLVPADGELTAS